MRSGMVHLLACSFLLIVGLAFGEDRARWQLEVGMPRDAVLAALGDHSLCDCSPFWQGLRFWTGGLSLSLAVLWHSGFWFGHV